MTFNNHASSPTIEFESEFKPSLYDNVVFRPRLSPHSGGKYMPDTCVTLEAINYPDRHEGYKIKNFSSIQLRKWFASVPILIAYPTLQEIYKIKMPELYVRKTWALLNRRNVTFLVDSRLDRYYWKENLSQYVPEVVRNLKEEIDRTVDTSIITDAINIAIAACEEQTFFSFDLLAIEKAFNLGVSTIDSRITSKLPYDIPPKPVTVEDK